MTKYEEQYYHDIKRIADALEKLSIKYKEFNVGASTNEMLVNEQKTNITTNREWLNSLSNEEFVEWLFGFDKLNLYKTYEGKWDVTIKSIYPHFQTFIGNTNNARLAISLWLEEERVKINDTTTNN